MKDPPISQPRSSRKAFPRPLRVILPSLLVVALATLQTTVQVTVRAQPAQYGEAPMLAERVEAGDLPPVEERLPEADDIMVIEPVEEVGQYGGTLRKMHDDPGMGTLRMLMYDPPVRRNRDYTEYIPGLFKGWEFNEDGTVVTFFMRRGVKWSDGHPFTTEDILFWWEDLALNEDFGAITPPWWAFAEGELASLEIVDDYTFRFHLAAPNWSVPHVLAVGSWTWEAMMRPKHFLQQFHPAYNSEVEDYAALENNNNWWQTPGFPTLFAWYTVAYRPGESVAFERNPYYWKVDTAGNQLPYIDRIESREVPEEEVRILRIIGGEVDLSFRGAGTPRNLPVLIDNEERGGYRHLEGWINGAGAWPGIIVNQTFTGDDYLREVLRDKNFRRGLSLAIDREAIDNSLWFGLGTVQQGTITEQSWHFQNPEGRAVFEEWAGSYADYDTEGANDYLDAAGLSERDAQGWRLRADNGQRLELLLDVTTWGGVDINQEAAALLQNYWQAIGIRVILNQAPAPELTARFNAGQSHLHLAHVAQTDMWGENPNWIFVTGEGHRMWPLYTTWYQSGGASGEEPDELAQRLHALYQEGLGIPDLEDRHPIVWEAIRLHIDEGPFFIGTVAGLPMPSIANVTLRNIPDFGILGPWSAGAPGNTNPEQYFFRQQ